jgi:hypothetical protein
MPKFPLFRALAFALALAPLLSTAQFGFQRIDTIDVYESAVLKKYPWAGGMDYCQFSNIDLDFDGTEDLFVFDRTNNKILTFIQNGAPGSFDYVYAPQYESKFPEYQNFYDPLEDIQKLFNWVLLVDYNCDGKKDIFAHRSGGIKVFKNTGNVTDGLSFEQTSERIKSLQWGMQQFLYVSAVDLPGLVDIDGDSDIDVVTFGGTGQALEYHRNLSMETYGVCDSLIFEMKNICWGRFRESATTNAVQLWDTLVYPCDDQVPNSESSNPWGHTDDRHDGSSVLPLDMNNNGVMDLVLGDIAYPNLMMLMNGGTVPNTNSGMISFDTGFPSNSTAVDITVFPAPYHVDINNDGARDLVVTPASTVGSENRSATWYYENTGTDAAPVFEYQQDDFLQGEMIDVGSRSLPVYFDQNGDGLKDLLVSCAGHFDPGTGNQICSIYYYQNTGTSATPEFTLITQDWMGLSTMGIGYTLFFYPTFGDLDDDGDEDMVLGEYSGYCYYFENTGGAGSPAIFNTWIMLDNYLGDPLVEPTTAGIFVCPVLVDLDRDGDLDLALGRRNGKINYYENIGTASSYSFLFLTNSLGNVDVAEWWSTEGYAVPQFMDINGEYKLLVGSKTGWLHYYDNIDGNIGLDFTLVDSTSDNIQTGTYSAPAIADLNNDNRLEMIVGNERGGLALYKSASINNIGVGEMAQSTDVLIYPNPAHDIFTVRIEGIAADGNVTLTVRDLSGRIVFKKQTLQSQVEVDVSQWSGGTYVVEIVAPGFIQNEKLIVR